MRTEAPTAITRSPVGLSVVDYQHAPPLLPLSPGISATDTRPALVVPRHVDDAGPTRPDWRDIEPHEDIDLT